MRICLPAVAAAVACAVTVLPASAAPAALSVSSVPAKGGPVQADAAAAAAYAKAHPDSITHGVNNFGCKPAPAHPRPLILVHGTDATAYADWAGIAPRLVAAGYCVFALNYGGKPGGDSFGTEDLWQSAAQFQAFANRVLAQTKATKIDIMGYSQGATISRYYINKLGGAAKVNRWVGLASPSYGGVLYGIAPVAEAVPGGLSVLAELLSPAAVQQRQGSPFMNAVNAGGDTVPGVSYTTIGTRYDEAIQPASNVALRSPGATNIVIQDLCPINLTGHFNMVYDRFSQQLALNALDPNTAVRPVCEAVALGTGIPAVLGAGSAR